MSKYVIGVDIGTGSTKAIAVDGNGNVISSNIVPYPTLQPVEGQSEQDPDGVCNAFFTCVEKLILSIKEVPEAIVFSAAMHSLIAVDANGSPLAPMMIWADNRSASIADRVKRSAMGQLLYEQNGTPLHAMSPLFKIMWMKEHLAHAFMKAQKFISIKEYIWSKLFGVYEVDQSIASACGLMNITTCQWDSNALNLAGILENQMSRIVPTDFKRSHADVKACARLGVTQKTLFIMGASDGCLANLGSFATDPGVAALTIGTSSAIRVASANPVHNFPAMTFNYRLDESTFICGGPGNNGGVALKWYVENFLGKPLQTATDYDDILKSLADSSPGADGLIFLPYLFGERAPIWDSHASACFYGIKGYHKQVHFTRAVIEGISMALFDIADHLVNAGLQIDRIHVSGGFVRSNQWLKILANIFNKRLCLLHTDDASALGAAYIGLKVTGMISSYETLKVNMKEIYPDPSLHEVYQQKFKTYRYLYQQLTPIRVNH